MCLYIGIDTGHSNALHVDVAAGINETRKSPSFISLLTFAREDVILSEQFVPVCQGEKVAMTSGTKELVKVSENDHEPSLCGPFGGVHGLDVHGDINGDRVKILKVGD